MPSSNFSGSSRSGGDRRPLSRAERARARWTAQGESSTRRSYSSAPPAGPPPRAPRPRLRIGVILLYPLVLLSLGLNVVLIMELLKIRDSAFDSLDQVVAMVSDIENEVISIPIHIDEEFPVNVSVPFEYSATFPVNTQVPIVTTLVVPFDIMGKTIDIQVPVDMSVPVNLEVPVYLQKTFDINTTVPVKMDLSVDFRLADTPIPAYFDALRQAIEKLTEQSR